MSVLRRLDSDGTYNQTKTPRAVGRLSKCLGLFSKVLSFLRRESLSFQSSIFNPQYLLLIREVACNREGMVVQVAADQKAGDYRAGTSERRPRPSLSKKCFSCLERLGLSFENVLIWLGENWLKHLRQVYLTTETLLLPIEWNILHRFTNRLCRSYLSRCCRTFL